MPAGFCLFYHANLTKVSKKRFPGNKPPYAVNSCPALDKPHPVVEDVLVEIRDLHQAQRRIFVVIVRLDQQNVSHAVSSVSEAFRLLRGPGPPDGRARPNLSIDSLYYNQIF